MQATATQAIIPKARGMYAKRISIAEYEEFIRRRTVPELAVMLKRHPYFGNSLNTLAINDPHRGRIEELLSMDIFQKYQTLNRYDFSGGGFSAYYLHECEMNEILKALHLLSIGLTGKYIRQVPGYLVGKTQVDLFLLGQANSFAEVLPVVEHTPYYKPLKARYIADTALKNYPMAEAVILRAYYEQLFGLIGCCLKGRDAESTTSLFAQEVEIYNLELLFRIKTYFPDAYSTREIYQLMMPYTHRVPRTQLEKMVETKSSDVLLAMYQQSGAVDYVGPSNQYDLAAAAGRLVYRFAQRMLRLTASPVASLAAFISLAKLERDNVVNMMEGVRYGLEPEVIRAMLRF